MGKEGFTIEKSRELLGNSAEKLTDDQIKQLETFFRMVAKSVIIEHRKQKKAD